MATPLSLSLEDATVYNMTAPTQGLASLIILGLFERLGVKQGEGFDHIHGLIEATKRAFAVRDAEITDPRYVGDLSRFLEADWLNREVEKIDRKKAAPWGNNGDGDTIWMGVIDKTGLAVSFIQSVFWEYGSGVVLPRTGILWQNRGSSFSLDPKSVNPLTPGRKPFHTLNPPLALFRAPAEPIQRLLPRLSQPPAERAGSSSYRRASSSPASYRR